MGLRKAEARAKRERVLILARQGLSVKVMAARLGINATTVRNVCRDNGITPGNDQLVSREESRNCKAPISLRGINYGRRV